MEKFFGLILICLVAVGNVTVNAQSGVESQPSHRFSGLLYSDYYFILNNHDEDLEGENGFWARRVYFTYDNRLLQNVSARIRMEMNSPGDFSTNAKMEPYVKDLYLNWAFNENHSLAAESFPKNSYALNLKNS